MRRAAIVSVGVLTLFAGHLQAQVARDQVCRAIAGADGSGLCVVTNDRAMTDDQFKEYVTSQLELSDGASLTEVTVEPGVANAMFAAVSGTEVIGTLPVHVGAATVGVGAVGVGAAAGLGVAAAGLGTGLAVGLGGDDRSGSSLGAVESTGGIQGVSGNQNGNANGNPNGNANGNQNGNANGNAGAGGAGGAAGAGGAGGAAGAGGAGGAAGAGGAGGASPTPTPPVSSGLE